MATKSKGRKDLLDKFYTKPEVAKFCLNKLEEYISKIEMSWGSYVWIEPSAGNGAFLNELNKIIIAPLGIDIDPGEEIQGICTKQDYLSWIPAPMELANYGVVGNPPFGVANNLAIKFINHSAEFADIIAFILPNTFRKDSVYDKLNKYFWLEEVHELPKDSFTLDSQSYDVPCSFFIYQKKEEKREKSKLLNCEYFSFVKMEEADLELIRVGGRAGKVIIPINGKEYNYFIKVNTDKISIEDFVNIMNCIKYENRDWVVGPRSLSKNEIIRGFEKAIDGKSKDRQ